ncbi:MAG: hypothetical protein Q8Q17_01395 [bacterium]|nr:hypothetical protein [bacterium]
MITGAEKFNTALRTISQFGGRLSSLALCASIDYIYIETAVEDEIISLTDSLQKNPELLRLVELLAKAGAMKTVQPVSINAKKEA